MTEFRQWDIAEKFKCVELAALLLGVEPTNIGNQTGVLHPALARILDGYQTARTWILKSDLKSLPLQTWRRTLLERHPRALLSLELDDELQYSESCPNDHKRLQDWVSANESINIDHHFGRAEIVRWLDACGLSSVYRFDLDEVVRTTRWPWGNHHTEMLEHLEAAAKRFWTAYDPADPSTANTNATVSEWLQNNRNVSRTMADAIASILRADGLPTGPRK